jgi:hypothetical protein
VGEVEGVWKEGETPDWVKDEQKLPAQVLFRVGLCYMSVLG